MNLPTSWQAAKISQIIDDIVGGGTPSKTNPENFKGNIPFMTVKDMRGRFITNTIDKISKDALQNSTTKLVPPDTLVIATRMALGKIAKTTQATAINQDIKAIYPSNGVEKRYIEHFWRYRAQYIESIGTGTTVKGIRLEDIRSISIPVAPSNEQRRIADKLDRVLARVDTANEHLSRVAPLIKRFRQSVLAAATSGRLTEETSTTSRQVMLQDVALDFSYGSSEKSKPHGKVPVIRMGNIQGGSINWSNLVFTDNESEIEKYELTYGDVLFNRTNSPELVGKTAIYDQGPRAIYAGYLIRIKCTEELNPFYLNYCLNSPMGRAYCWSVKSDGVSQSNINAKKLAAFPFRLPSIEEQSEIVRRVEKLFAFADRLEERLSQAQAAVQKLTPALLAKAFRGELVPQDPNDEPASELLKRLQKSRTDSSKPSRARKPRARKLP